MDQEVSIGLRISKQLRDAIQKLADKEERPFSNMTRILLKKGLAQHTRYVATEKREKC